RPLDLLFFIYFVVHIPTTVLIDAQILLPSHFFPEALRGLLEYWVTMSGDPFIRLDQAALDPSLVWYATFVAGELIFQLPFFFYAALQLYRDSPCLPLPLAIYGAHVSTTVAPILASVWLAVPHLTMDQRYILTSAYAPYLIIPLLM
ncbi:transmembrane protein 6/97, partial [Dimargaris cristalligena]